MSALQLGIVTNLAHAQTNVVLFEILYLSVSCYLSHQGVTVER